VYPQAQKVVILTLSAAKRKDLLLLGQRKQILRFRFAPPQNDDSIDRIHQMLVDPLPTAGTHHLAVLARAPFAYSQNLGRFVNFA